MLETNNHDRMPSNRSFGALFAAICAMAAAYGQFKGWGSKVHVLWAVAAMLGVIALMFPSLLLPLNRAWFKLGQLLGRIMNPIVIGVVFFAIFTPMALMARLLGHDELRLKRRAADTYWISREPPGPAADSFDHQY